jgi:mannitol/fructose-specific phosphotransferase system IIA component (Ntr-type)
VISPTELLADPDAVLFHLEAASGEEAVRALHERLVGTSDAVGDGPRFLADLLARMRLGPVCVADGVAMPHARTVALDRLVLAIGRAPAGIRFDAEHPRVGLIFLIGTPKNAVTEYLRAVSVFSRVLRNAVTRAALLTAPDEESFRALLAGGLLARR